MKTITDIHPGDLVIDGPTTVTAIVNGNITVTAGGDLIFCGICNGKLVLEPGGRATVTGIVNGGIDNQGGDLKSGPSLSGVMFA
ncbi:MAG: hypothetical protein JWM57_3788 [Phycisphaerales bacterium]|nr:hypothetical protein [Phycisphaerales bacterium]